MRLYFVISAIIVAFTFGVISRPALSGFINGPEPIFSPRVVQFQDMNDQLFDIVLVGDSLTDHGRWSELLPLRVANRGIGRDTVRMVTARADLIPAGPTYIMIGVNDLVRGRAIDEVVEDYTELLNALGERAVVIQAVLGPETVPVEALNQQLAVLANETGARFLDLSPVLGYPLRTTYDGIHLTSEGYRLWADALARDWHEHFSSF